MAIVKFINKKSEQSTKSFKGVIMYCVNEAKTVSNGCKLVTGINCMEQSAYTEMMNTKMQYGKENGRMYYHLVQSFSPDDNITPEKAHRIAIEFAQEFKGFEVLVSTHSDKEHIHSHLVINSVNAETGKKYHADSNEINRLRAVSDSICMKYGLSVIDNPAVKMTDTMSAKEYRSADKGESWKINLAATINIVMKTASDKQDFIRKMNRKGYGVRWDDNRKYITYSRENEWKCRDKRLHDVKYLKENMEYEFRIRKEISERIYNAGREESAGITGSRNLRNSYGDELESAYGFSPCTDSGAYTDAGTAEYAGNGQRSGSVYEPYADESRKYGTGTSFGNGEIQQGNFEEDRGNRASGWEDEREYFAESLLSSVAAQENNEEAGVDWSDTVSGFYSAGIDSLYLVADLLNIGRGPEKKDYYSRKHMIREKKSENQGIQMRGY